MYVILFSGLTLLRWAAHGSRTLYVILLFSVFLFLFLFSSFRFEVGCDWPGYYFQYIQFSDLSLDK